MRHTHGWREIARRYTPPRHFVAESTGHPVREVLLINSGFTSIELRCSCGDVKFVTEPGDQT